MEGQPEHLTLYRHRGLALRAAAIRHRLNKIVLPRAAAVGLWHAEEDVVDEAAILRRSELVRLARVCAREREREVKKENRESDGERPK